VSFRRILRASDFADTKATLCFKKLLMQPRPVLQFGSEGDSIGSSGGNSGTGGKCTPVKGTSSASVGSGGSGREVVVGGGVSKASDKEIAGRCWFCGVCLVLRCVCVVGLSATWRGTSF